VTTVISVENLSKTYHLGQIGTGTFSNDMKIWWAKVRGKPNPMLRIGETDHGNRDGEDLLALKDVSFTVKQGEVLGIIGRNGAGKSTLLKILSRVTAPTSGKIKVKGRVASLLEVGTGFHPELTGRENIYLNGAILGMSRKEIDSKFDEVVDFAEVEKFIDTPVKRYSSGMYVRLAFAVAAHLDPEILVVDEVLAVGDAEFQKKCLGKMSDVANQGRSVLFVSHNMLAVQNLCQKAIWLSGGEIESNGPVMQIIGEYLKSASLLASVSLDFRRDRQGDGRLRFREILILDEFNNPVSSVQSGQNITFDVGFDMQKNLPLRDVAFQISFLNDLGQRLFILLTRFSGGNFAEIKPGDRVRCIVPFFPLLPGRYTLHLIAKEGYQFLDAVLDAFQLDVVAGDVFNSGKLQEPSGGNFVVPHRWEKLNHSDETLDIVL
jgi:lipopolysaccharide transport system ATP-binding protein